MPEQTRASGVTVVLPDHLAVDDGADHGVRRRRGDGAAAVPDAETEAMLAAFADQGIAVLDRIDIVPRDAVAPPSGRRRRGAAQVPAVSAARFDVPLDAGEDAVVLLEQEGVYSWQLSAPEPPAAGRRRAAGRRAVFDVELRARETAAQRRSRGFLGRLLLGPVRAIVLKFAAKVAVGLAMSHLERDARRGLVMMNGPDAREWTTVERLDPAQLPPDRPARVLLFVHGTFSSTVGSFGSLGLTSAGARLLQSAQSDYDLVLGFDHLTLSEDPLTNATDLLRRLGHPAHPPIVHAVAYSRGGLVLRSLVEHLLPLEQRGAKVERAVFVACTNGGTQLADPANWTALLDLYTNIAAAGSRVVGLIPGAQVAGLVLGEAVRGLGAFAKYLVTQAISPDGVPGLYAMAPDGPFVAAISTEQPGQPTPAATRYYVVSSNFDVSLLAGDDSAFPARLKAALQDGLIDRLMNGTPNDLVVDVPSMSRIDPVVGDFVDDEHHFPSNGRIFHNVYFAQDEVADLIAGWFAPPASANGGGRTVSGGGGVVSGPVPAPGRRRQRGERSAAPRSEAQPPPPARNTPAAPRRRRAAEPVRTHVLAEMESEVTVAATTTLAVTLSRDEIVAAGGRSSAGVASLDPGLPLIVQVLPRANLRGVGELRAELEVPRPGAPAQLFFDLEPTHAGPGEVWVIVRQGQVPILTLTLTPSVVDAASPHRSVAALSSAGAAVDAAVPDRDVNQLEISEDRQGDELYYTFQLQAPDLGLYEEFRSGPITGDREAYVKALYARIEERWLSTDGDEADFARELRGFGVELLDELVPEKLQEILWKHRENLAGIMATCTEPFIPWELVHLRNPRTRGLPRETIFLGQLGLVRWLLGSWPPERLRIRAGKARYIVPEYPDPDFALPETGPEREYLESTFRATRVRPTQRDVVSVLSKPGRFDLLHFAGHGLASSADISAAEIMLQGRMEGGRYVRDALTASTVDAVADLAGTGPRPIVVLNACQTARQGVKLTSIGGFADAFVGNGAGVFVSSLWSVGDVPARGFVEAFYAELRSGRTVAEAAASGRAKARADGDATWLAYAVYGHPMARLDA